MTDSASERRHMADVLMNYGILKSPWLRAAIEVVPVSGSSTRESSWTRGGPGGLSPPPTRTRMSG